MTNDFGKSKALNMVIKLASVGDKPCVKISDELTKVSVFFWNWEVFFFLDMCMLLFISVWVPLGHGMKSEGERG